DKLVDVGVLQTAHCVFHCGELESTDHLFFQCSFSANVWLDVLRLCNISRPILPWANEVLWMSAHAKGNQFHHRIRKLAFAATVYHIWLERNRRCFNNRFLPPQEIVLKVRMEVSGKLTTANNAQKDDRHHGLCINWGIPIPSD
ncbi:zf-RVT domain-containing protein, partial [Cephalotus follicularis]